MGDEPLKNKTELEELESIENDVQSESSNEVVIDANANSIEATADIEVTTSVDDAEGVAAIEEAAATVPAETEATAETPVVDSPAEAAPVVEAAPVTEPTPTAEIASDTKTKKKKGGKIGVLIAVLILLLAAGGAGAWFLLNNGSQENANNPVGEETKKEGSEYRISGNDLSDFDLKFLKLEDNGTDNIVYSPISMKYALSMLADGAKGETQKQIKDIIGDYKAKRFVNSKNMSFANAIFINNKYKDSISSSYRNTLDNKYAAFIITDPFINANTMNNWTKDYTLGQISNLISDESVNPDSIFFLINALAINMDWTSQLQCRPTYGPKDGDNDTVIEKCDKTEVYYRHVNIGEYLIPDIINGDNFERVTFGNEDNIRAAKIGAVINNYDLVKSVGEDKVRKTVDKAYDEWCKSPEGNEVGCMDRKDDVIKAYMKDLEGNKTNYRSTGISILNNDKVKAFSKDLESYGDTTLQYVAIMPKEDSLSDYIKNTDAKKLGEIIGGIKELKSENFKKDVITKIYGTIPFYSYDGSLKFVEDLSKIGITDVFDADKADLSGIIETEGGNPFVQDAVHKARIDFSNDGIRAGAATGIEGGLGDGGGFDYIWDVPIEEIDMTFDKPFMYLIRDKNTGEVWFTGAVYKAGDVK